MHNSGQNGFHWRYFALIFSGALPANCSFSANSGKE
jgi:hypothetical protein